MSLIHYIPQYIKTKQNKTSKSIVTATDWNTALNLLQSQGDNNSAAINTMNEAFSQNTAAGLIGAKAPGALDSTVQSELDALYRLNTIAGNIPIGGAAGQVLKKKTAADCDTEWGNVSDAAVTTTAPVNEALGLTMADPTVKDAVLTLATAFRPNMLDNADFTEPTNSAGQTTYATAWSNAIDRWKIGANTQLEVLSGCVKLTNTTASGTAAVFQYPQKLMAGTYTLSVSFSENTGVVSITNYQTDNSQATVVSSTASTGTLLFTFTVVSDMTTDTYQRICITTSCKLLKAKLEKGSTSTLTIDTSNSTLETLRALAVDNSGKCTGYVPAKVGTIMQYQGNDLGDKWALCNGDVVTAAKYPSLLKVLQPTARLIEQGFGVYDMYYSKAINKYIATQITSAGSYAYTATVFVRDSVLGSSPSYTIPDTVSGSFAATYCNDRYIAVARASGTYSSAFPIKVYTRMANANGYPTGSWVSSNLGLSCYTCSVQLATKDTYVYLSVNAQDTGTSGDTHCFLYVMNTTDALPSFVQIKTYTTCATNMRVHDCLDSVLVSVRETSPSLVCRILKLDKTSITEYTFPTDFTYDVRMLWDGTYYIAVWGTFTEARLYYSDNLTSWSSWGISSYKLASCDAVCSVVAEGCIYFIGQVDINNARWAKLYRHKLKQVSPIVLGTATKSCETNTNVTCFSICPKTSDDVGYLGECDKNYFGVFKVGTILPTLTTPGAYNYIKVKE